jgi:hypothetical protein
MSGMLRMAVVALALAGCHSGDGGGGGGGDCAAGCDKLAGCQLCLQANGQCLTRDDCVTTCEDQSKQAVGQCIANVQACDETAINQCLQNGGNNGGGNNGGGDVCTQACSKLDQCQLCAQNAQGQCLSNDECVQGCQQNNGQTQAQCVLNVQGCDQNAIGQCITGQ